MESKVHSFKDLNAYKEAKELVKNIYGVVQMLPQEERYALADQLRRAVISVPSNIVEGMNRISDKEKAHFLKIAYASLMEVYCQVDIATDLGYIENCKYEELEQSINGVARLISGLRKYTLTPKH